MAYYGRLVCPCGRDDLGDPQHKMRRESDKVYVYYHGVCLPKCPDNCKDCANERQSFVVVIGDEFKGRKAVYDLNL